LSSAVLGVWVLALLVGIANACGWDDAFAHSPDVDVHQGVGHTGHDVPVPDCAKLCAEAVPVVAKHLAVLASEESQPHFVAASYRVGPTLDPAPALRRRSVAQPPRAAPPFLRFLRLTL
jgi:hypothetical protein